MGPLISVNSIPMFAIVVAGSVGGKCGVGDVWGNRETERTESRVYSLINTFEGVYLFV